MRLARYLKNNATRTLVIDGVILSIPFLLWLRTGDVRYIQRGYVVLIASFALPYFLRHVLLANLHTMSAWLKRLSYVVLFALIVLVVARVRLGASLGYALIAWSAFYLGCTFWTLTDPRVVIVESDEAQDLRTPEGAIRSLEDAYRRKDIEAAIRCKDFRLEAEMVLARTGSEMRADPRVISSTAEALELSFRKQLKDQGFPNFDNVVESTFPEKKDIADGKVIVKEVCRYRDGGTSVQNILVQETATGWKVLVPVSDEDAARTN